MFKVGDSVVHSKLGWIVEVFLIQDSEITKTPVCVKGIDGTTDRYTLDGRFVPSDVDVCIYKLR